MKIEPGVGGVELKVECGCLDCFLFVAGKPGKAVGKGVGMRNSTGL
jgi:hypothetical protein